MTLNLLVFTDAEPSHVYIEITPDAQAQIWQQQRFSTPSRRWNAYLNQICLDRFLDWLRHEYPQATAWTSPAHYPAYWDVVDGCAIALPVSTQSTLPAKRLVLIPSPAIDTDELRVPQEWVDIPSWAGDYYLAVQVDPDDGWIHIWGFTTHIRLKSQGHYDAGDRTYAISAEHLIQDLNVLWDAQELCPDDITRATLAPLPALSLPQAEHLIARLGNPEMLLSRLEVPFTLWGALLDHAGWRQRLYQRRVQLPEQGSVLQWLAGNLSQAAQQLGWVRVDVQPNLVGARGTEPEPTPGSSLSRSLVIAGQRYELRIIPQGDPEQGIWRIELRRAASESADPQEQRLPRGMKLRLLTEDLQAFDNNETTATTAVERLYLVVALEPGEGLVWEIEPTPEDYEREILRF
jgi:hypothetical protein